MIFLELANRIVIEAVQERFGSDKERSLDITCADFDGAMFHVFTTQNKKTELNVSLRAKCFSQIQKLDSANVVKESLKSFRLPEAEPGYDFTLQFDLTKATTFPATLADDVASMKTFLYNVPFIYTFRSTMQNKLANPMIDIPYRDEKERLFIKQQGADRVVVLFSVLFRDSDDVVIGKVFLQELIRSVSGAPSVSFTFDKPGELQGVNFPADKRVGFISFVLFRRHFDKPATGIQAAHYLQTFRNYLHYHIKCCKAQLHEFMRIRVDYLLKILTRAKQDLPKEKKTFSGRSFKRAPGKESPKSPLAQPKGKFGVNRQ